MAKFLIELRKKNSVPKTLTLNRPKTTRDQKKKKKKSIIYKKGSENEVMNC